MKQFSEGQKRKRAVALRHDAEQDDVPRIVAKGLGANAEKILELAFANGIKVREDSSLAEILGAFDIDSLVPAEALYTVAEILTYLYQAEGRLEDHEGELDALRAAARRDPAADV